jgi:hypothetical protein
MPNKSRRFQIPRIVKSAESRGGIERMFRLCIFRVDTPLVHLPMKPLILKVIKVISSD